MRRRRGGSALLGALVLAAVALACSQDPEDAPGIGVDTAAPDVAQLLPDDRGEPPGELVVEDVSEGDGAPVTSGAVIEAHVGALRWSDGGEVAWTWHAGRPLRIEVAAGQVIPGFERGLVNMREGGRRMLIVPPELAYGDDGAGTDVGPDEALVFVVDLLTVERRPSEQEPSDDPGPSDDPDPSDEAGLAERW